MIQLSLEERKEILISILNSVDSYCRENNLKYFLAYGSLLGAIRHKGFIPWDDDIDIVMPRADYEKLIANFNIGRSDSYKVHSIHSDKNYMHQYAKVSDTDTIMVEESQGATVIGVNLDIFPIDKLSNDIDKALALYRKIKFYKLLKKTKIAEVGKNRKLHENLAVILLAWLPRFRILNRIDILSQKYNSLSQSKYCGVACVMGYGEQDIFDSCIFDEATDVEFEGGRYNAPLLYDAFLKQIYGDYLKLPPEDQRKSHHNEIAYKK